MPARADLLADQLRTRISALPPGAPLPSVRDLCRETRASPLTMQAALAALGREGRIRTVPGKGSFVDAVEAPRPHEDVGWQSVVLGAQSDAAAALEVLSPLPAPGLLALSAGYIDASLQPLGALSAAMARAARRPGTWGRMPVEGHPELRAWFAREAGGGLTAADTLVVPGGQAALAVIFRGLLAPGAPVLVESPTYPGAVAAARAAGLRPVPVPIDGEGLRPDLLDAAFRATGARVVYTQPSFANPTGALQSEARRVALLELARRHGAFVVEDDYLHDVALGTVPPTLVSRDAGRVVYVRSLTKSSAPSLRVAAICARGPVFARLRAARLVDDLFVSGVLQETALDLVSGPAWRTHLRHLARTLGARMATTLDALDAVPALRVAHRPRGGQNLFVALPAGSDDTTVARQAEARGVFVSAGRTFFPAEADGAWLRLTVCAAPEEALREGVRRLGEVVAG